MSEPTKKRAHQGGHDSTFAKRMKGLNIREGGHHFTFAKRIKGHNIPKRADPIKYLVPNVVNIIASHLTPQDVVRMERVSKAWQLFAVTWLDKLGNQLMDGPSPVGVQLDKLTCGDEKRYICQLYALRKGHPASILEIEYNTRPIPDGLIGPVCWRRHFVVWPTMESSEQNPVQADGQQDVLGDTLRWTRFPDSFSLKINSEVRQLEGRIPATQFSTRGTSETAVITHLAANDQSIILVQLTFDRDFGSHERNVVYSIADHRVLWQEDTDPTMRDGSERQPYLLGEERVYTSQYLRATGENWLVAYDFRTGAQLYKSRPHMHDSSLSTKNMKLLQAARGEEVLIQLSDSGTEHRAHIIRGINGHLLGQVELKPHPMGQFRNMVTYPASGQMAILDYTFYRGPPAQRLADQRPIRTLVVIFKHYSYDPDTGYSHRCTDAVLIDATGRGGIPSSASADRRHESLSAFNPFFMALLRTCDLPTVPPVRPVPPGLRPTCGSWPLIPTEDKDQRRIAEAALVEEFGESSLSPPLRHCLVPG
ncbi:uncharacterized protein DSM5745_09842 [Aspergillus mulundensis]|uniref:F-box domain-containing protein n=1 Tax=Aspergillus mulundensis TaxID=1810919 RepID=A0A3D8QRX4_9EURO|nr:hypothetical protein DSM5745_09842 [Aspergillus mulundensis]RDW64431.1 hypothetical protein DSM5745_09842 [Aspergillus mulundensis]